MQDIFWINGSHPPHAAIVMRPRGDDWLDGEMSRIRAAGIDTLVSMLEPDEAQSLGLSDEEPAAKAAGMLFLSFPIPDRHVPDNLKEFRAFAKELAARLRAGEKIGFHCRGCIGRATIASACALIQLGWDAPSALLAIAVARGTPVPDTPEQEIWILEYEAAG